MGMGQDFASKPPCAQILPTLSSEALGPPYTYLPTCWPEAPPDSGLCSPTSAPSLTLRYLLLSQLYMLTSALWPHMFFPSVLFCNRAPETGESFRRQLLSLQRLKIQDLLASSAWLQMRSSAAPCMARKKEVRTRLCSRNEWGRGGVQSEPVCKMK